VPGPAWVLAAVCGLSASAFAAPFVSAQATSGVGALDLDGEGSASLHIVKVAQVSLFTDGLEGLTLVIAPAELGKVDGSTPIAFQIVIVARDAAAPSSAAFTTPAGTIYTLDLPTGSSERDLYIKYLPRVQQDPGTYNASVMLAVSDR
jgi:hypothetical protein